MCNVFSVLCNVNFQVLSFWPLRFNAVSLSIIMGDRVPQARDLLETIHSLSIHSLGRHGSLTLIVTTLMFTMSLQNRIRHIITELCKLCITVVQDDISYRQYLTT